MSSPQQQKKKPEASEGTEDKPVTEKTDKPATAAKKQQGEGKEKAVKKDDKTKNDGEGKEKPKPKKEGEQKKNNNNNNNAPKQQNKPKPAPSGDAQPRRKKSEATPAPAGASDGRGALQFDDNERRKKAVKKQILALKPVAKQVALFGHLPQYDRTSSAGPVTSSQPSHDGLHPEIVRLGLTYGDRSLLGSSARTVGMLTAFKQVIRDYKTPPQKSLALDLDAKLKPLIQYLIDCRPLAIGMGNAIKHLKSQIGHTISMTEDEAKEFLIDEIDRFIQERIIVADQQLTAFTSQKINNGDVILTYAGSHVIELALKKAYDEGKKFKVIVVDSRPKFEGKVLLKRLVQHGIHCTYIMLNAISYILKEVSKVLIGAHALLSNGSVFSRAGTSLIAMMAHHCDHTVPVIVATETFKFAERVQLDSICFNELDDPDYLNITNPNENLRDWKDNPQLKLLNLVYDVTPIEYIDVVITEVGMIPPTSVPVVIREYRKDLPSM